MAGQVFELRRGGGPLLVSMPHVGTALPESLLPRFTAVAQSVIDTDWRVDELYDFLEHMDVSVLRARYSRYVVDLNRFAHGESLYRGATDTAVCPLTSFAGEALYLPGEEPAADEIQQRLQDYWQPYHATLAAELIRLQAIHSYALLWDAHSIRAVVPHLFEGQLPDLNFGTAEGAACAPDLISTLESVAGAAADYSWVSNGRFKGGAITRSYGRPHEGVHAIQLELSQSTYLQQEYPFQLDHERAQAVRPVLKELIEAALDWTPADAPPKGAQ